LEAIQRQAGQESTGRGQSQAGNGHHDPQLRTEWRVGNRELGQFAIDVSDLGLNGRQHRSLQLGDQRLSRGVAGRMLTVAQAQALLDQRLASRQ
jgi:hypothetical protein